jgi:hypothetical protein
MTLPEQDAGGKPLHNDRRLSTTDSIKNDDVPPADGACRTDKSKKQQQRRASSSRQQRRVCDDDDDDDGTGSSICAAIAEPPSVWSLSPFISSSSASPLLQHGCAAGGLRRKLVHQTPQHVATLHVPSAPSPSSSTTTTINTTFAVAPPLLYQEKYLIHALSSSSSTSSGNNKIAFWMLSSKRSIFCGYQPEDSRYKNSTFRKTPLPPDFILDTRFNAPIVELATMFFDDGDNHDEQGGADEDATASAADSSPHKPQQQYPDLILALSTLGEVCCISIYNNSSNSQQPQQQQHQGVSTTTTTTTTSFHVEAKTKSSSSSSSATNSSSRCCCTANVLFSWNTGRAGATCLTTCSSRSGAHNTEPTGKRGHRRRRRHERQVLIGYQSGHLEAWIIRWKKEAAVVIDDNDENSGIGTAAAAASAAASTTFTAEKLWTGVFDHHFPIHSLLVVPAAARSLEHGDCGPTAAIPNNTAATTTSSNGGVTSCREAQDINDNNNVQQYLALTLHPPTRLSTPSYMEVINLTAVQEEATAQQHNAKQQQERAADDDDDNNNNNMESATTTLVMALENHWVLPLPGKEIRDPAIVLRGRGDAATNGDLLSRGGKKRATNKAAAKAAGANSTKPCAVHWIPSSATNRLCSLGRSRDGCSNGPGFAVALADGTIGLVSATLAEHSSSSSSDSERDENDNSHNNGSNNSRLDWGISHQLLLSYPCIGLGKVDLQSTPHAVCALRGGTVYLLPLLGTGGTNDHGMSPSPPPPLTVIMYPDDLDTDTVMQHLQSFAAGMIVSDKDSSDVSETRSTRLPLLFFTWPGGVIDVYSCHLLRSDAQVNLFALDELLANGSAESLKSLLLTRLDDHGGDCRADLVEELGPSDSVAMAKSEIEGLNGKDLTSKDLSSEKLKTFRSILLRFAGQ